MEVLDLLASIVTGEFIGAVRVNSCFPLSLIFYEESKKLGFDPVLVEGYSVLPEFACRHYWVQVEDKIYDLRDAMHSELIENFTPPKRALELRGENFFEEPEVNKLLHVHYCLVRATGSTEYYFKGAPAKLLAMRARIAKAALSLHRGSGPIS